MSRDPRPGAPSLKRRRPTAHPVQEPPGMAARRGAMMLLGDVLERGGMLGEGRLDRLPPAARAEARSLADLTLRRLGQIDHLLAGLLEHMPKPPVRHVLRLMAAELTFGGVAPHAAVDTAVRLARATEGAGRLAGLVNAIGRRIAEAPPPADDPVARRRNLPRWLWTRLAADWGEAETDAIAAAHLMPAPHDLVFRDPDEAEAMTPTLGGTVLAAGVLRLADRPQISALPGHPEGKWWVQDFAASLPARLLGPVAGARVLDLCAAPGGKTMQLAAAGAEVTALDISAARMTRLADNLARTGLAAQLVTADALEWEPEAPFDAILIDAPCSATGTIRRHPDLPWRKGAGDVTALAGLQARLLDRAFGWLAPGGRLVFATCSLLKAEGEAQAAGFLARSPSARRMAFTTDDLPPEFLTPEGDLRTRPSMLAGLGGLDGFFATRIERRG
ncbi:methyltransferase domain-containing protein [Limibaculum sp. FT325]|uniref:RsmB/NOP family class I SAM-dependent RNA methyltransferase n=1 Tax=Thermohalobaculum sediminis TaxID=2939436 RepID=UPI0020BEA978|nr:transcription antitermination factor NusB [Limibaculum sediminis]MCL5776322.1 methyltransferase domain-containing protein [Limibaculum sediminis]